MLPNKVLLVDTTDHPSERGLRQTEGSYSRIYAEWDVSSCIKAGVTEGNVVHPFMLHHLYRIVSAVVGLFKQPCKE